MSMDFPQHDAGVERPVIHSETSPQLNTLIIGASWSGLWLLNLRKKRGDKVVLLDNNPEVGGTWYYTRYPGCRVDTEVPLYAYSDPEIWRNWNWSERFPRREEIHKYLLWFSHHQRLRENIKLSTWVTGATWDERDHYWTVSCSDGTNYTARYLIGCVGYTTVKYEPDWKGLHGFKQRFHTIEWPENLDCAGKKIGVVGTGASGLQIIEQLARTAGHLTVFQRTPNFATPARQEQFTPERSKELKKSYPDIFKNRLTRTGFHSVISRNTDEDPEKRESVYRSLWDKGGMWPWLGNYKDLFYSSWANEQFYQFWRREVWKTVSNRQVAEKLAPRTAPHNFGTKRPSLEQGYFQVFNQPNVELVDLNEEPVKEVFPNGVVTKTKFHELDILVLATGFDAITGSMSSMRITGVNDTPLKEKWDISPGGDGVKTYLGLMTTKFPNMFVPMGPQAPTALGITPHMAEMQGGWVSQCIDYMTLNGYTRIEPTLPAEQGWGEHVNKASMESLFSKTDSWYMGNSIPGRKKQALCYFGGVDKYDAVLNDEARRFYPNFSFSSSQRVLKL